MFNLALQFNNFPVSYANERQEAVKNGRWRHTLPKPEAGHFCRATCGELKTKTDRLHIKTMEEKVPNLTSQCPITYQKNQS